MRKLEGNETLDEVVSMFGEQDILHIGSQSNFFFVGTKTEYESDIDGISKSYEEQLQTRLKTAEDEISSTAEKLKNLKIGEDEKTIEYAERVQNIAKRYKYLFSYIPKVKKDIKEFTPLRTRKLKERYKRIKEGYAIIVDGKESGKYWDLSEYKSKGGEEDD